MAKIMTKGGVVIEIGGGVEAALAIGEKLELKAPMFSRPEEICHLSVTALLTLLSPAYWWRTLLEVNGNLQLADSIKLSPETARISGVLEVKYLSPREWVLIRRTPSGSERAHWVRLNGGWHLEDGRRPFHLDGYHAVRREAILGLVSILAVREEEDSRESVAASNARRHGFRRAHYRRLDVCGRIGHQAPPKPLLDRRPAFTWVPQVCQA